MQPLSPVIALLAGEPAHWCPGCKQMHRINVNEPNSHSGAIWTWDANAESPTFSPSINIVGYCHYFIKAGNIEFLSDCKHELAGKTVPIPAIDSEEREFWRGSKAEDFK